jgi:hypothetical protein
VRAYLDGRKQSGVTCTEVKCLYEGEEKLAWYRGRREAHRTRAAVSGHALAALCPPTSTERLGIAKPNPVGWVTRATRHYPVQHTPLLCRLLC